MNKSLKNQLVGALAGVLLAATASLAQDPPSTQPRTPAAGQPPAQPADAQPAQPQQVAEGQDTLPVPLATDRDKASYGLGANIARDLMRNGWEINLEALVLGMRDVLAGRDLRVDETAMRQAMIRFQEQAQAALQAKMKAEAEKNLKEGTAFLENNGKRQDVRVLPSGLQYRVVQDGTGPTPTRTDSVRTHYRGMFLDGTEFDSSYKRGEPAVFGVEDVIPGWTEALLRMKVGSKWRIFLPPNLGYGEQGSPPVIGPNAVLVFDIELLGIE